ncbi:MAG: hypothetical protein ABMA01_01115 [Chthoniobacteraceae bacterium]
MKTRHLLPMLLVAAIETVGHAALIYSGVQNVPVPLTLDGAYLRISDGVTTGAYPADWSTAPWLNPFFGGVYVATSGLLRPVVTGSDQIVNLSAGTLIDGTRNFAAGESGSTTHTGPAANQFQIGASGLVGFVFETTGGGPSRYGWARLQVNNAGAGSIVDWAYESTPEAGIYAGEIAPVPEPAGVAVGLLCVAAGLLSRRRPRIGCGDPAVPC